MNFNTFRQAVAEQFAAMSSHQLLTTGTIVDPEAEGLNYPELAARFGDDLWATYLASFKEGENPIHRQRGVYDCSCCRNFIRKSNIVAIIDGKVQTIWDVKVPEFQHVADALRDAVLSQPINNIFLHDSPNLGTRQNIERIDGVAVTYDHFHVSVPARFVKPEANIPTALTGPRTKQYTLIRAVREILPDAVSTVLELIASNSLARGDQFKGLLTEFKKVQNEILNRSLTTDFNTLGWEYTFKVGDALAAIRGSSIGTLLQELTQDPADLEGAVGRFERMVAGDNYKRPTALVTPKMIEDAKAKVNELGLTAALDRRFAVIDDISARHVLFVDRDSRVRLKDSPFDDLVPTAKAKPLNLDRVEEISIEKFMADVLPTITSIEVAVERQHAEKKVALMTGVAGLFSWDNGFSWSYVGNYADAVKQRVKAAGGNVDGDVCIRLAWSNGDDLDLHVHEPTGRVYYMNKGPTSNGGTLDVDMNAGGDRGRGPHTPVENIVYVDKSRMKPGNYRVEVNNFARVTPADTGFTVDIDVLGTVHHFEMSANPNNRATVAVANIVVTRDNLVKVEPLLPSTTTNKTATPDDFVKVNAIVASPNTWDTQSPVGQKHWFFLLDGWKMDEPTRGFFNEQLKPELNPHRKVLELLGGKTLVDPATAPEQLVGLGFTATGKDQQPLVVRVKGNIERVLKITF